ncbi:MAG: hypothetical protein JNN29_00090 [Chitinophagaceae bacterium]|nr:hypothetical protein [Chitinophagaceae bacterium]
MNLEYKYHLVGNFDPGSRVWIYQASRLFSIGEALEIEELLEEFVRDWKSHGTPVKGSAHLFFGRFIVLIADETATGVSGCSTDSSVRLIKTIETKYQNPLFDRTLLAFVVKDRIEMLPLNQLKYAWDNQFITEDTLYFNNLVDTKKSLEEGWIIPVKESWLMQRVSA